MAGSIRVAWRRAVLLAFVLSAVDALECRSDDCLQIKDYRVCTCNGESESPCAEAEESEELRFFGPCPCEPRGTLLQWSYRTSFSGGPPGRDEPLASDRPDFTEASVTVGRGVAQVEMGYTYAFDRDGTDFTKSHSAPEMLWRVGLFAEWLEFRVAYNHLLETSQVDGVRTTLNGSEDLYLGIKLGLTPQEGILPEMALVPQMTIPSGSRDLTADEVLPGVNWLYGWDVTGFISTAGSTQFNRAVDDAGQAYTEFAQSWTIGYSLSDRLGAYTEWFAIIPHSADAARTEHYFDGGFTFRVTNDLQLDIRGGVGLNSAADDYFLGTGMVVRM